MLETTVINDIEVILDGAFKAGRGQLYEHEVYRILGHLGIPVPPHLYYREPADVNGGALNLFSSGQVVLKIVSPSIAHKQKAGGVLVLHKDLGFIRYAAERMLADFRGRQVEAEGFLLVDYIEYSKDLGNEVLLGFRESDAFGPVISFSKGGSDAEFFAAHFSQPNLILPPVDREWATALLMSTRIQKKYTAEGKTDYIAKIVDMELKLASLSTAFSNYFEGKTKYAITEFEINPFVFARGGIFLALDGYAVFERKREMPVSLAIKPRETLKPFFEPKGIVVVGVSTRDSLHPGNIIVENLCKLGWENLYCVNPKGGRAMVEDREFPLYRAISEVPDTVDLAVITVPAEHTYGVVEQCAARGILAALLIPGGFGEIEKNMHLEDAIYELAQSRGMRILGPNCLGVVCSGAGQGEAEGRERGIGRGINTFFIPEEKFRVSLEGDKNVAIFSQSGAMGIMEIYNLKNAISPRVVVSYGNQLDIDPSDLVGYFNDDSSVDVMGLYIEGFKPAAGRRFFNITSQSRKPVVVYKAGRTEAGKRAAQSHTASIAGEYEVAKAAMKQAGLIVAESMIDHGDFVKTFALLHDFKVSGNRVAVIANAGYEKTYAADNLGDLALAELDDGTKRELREILPPFVGVDTLLDLTPMVSDEDYDRCIDLLLSSDRVDALCVSIVPQAQVLHTTDREITADKDNVAVRIVNTVKKHKKPVVVSVNVVYGADALYNKFGQVLDSGGVPTFLTAERAMVCLNAFIRYRLNRERMRLSEWLK